MSGSYVSWWRDERAKAPATSNNEQVLLAPTGGYTIGSWSTAAMQLYTKTTNLTSSVGVEADCGRTMNQHGHMGVCDRYRPNHTCYLERPQPRRDLTRYSR